MTRSAVRFATPTKKVLREPLVLLPIGVVLTVIVHSMITCIPR